jgi:hypothetical protein
MMARSGRGRDGRVVGAVPGRANLPRMRVGHGKRWTQEQFFSWAASQEGRYEFDGFLPVAMTGGTVNHSRIVRNVLRGLDTRLRGGPASRSDWMPGWRPSDRPSATRMRW